MTRRLGLLAILWMAFSAMGCALQKPTLQLKSVSLKDADLEGTTLDVVYTLTNPNPIGLQLASADCNLQVEGHPVVSGTPSAGLAIPPAGSAELTFPARVHFKEIAPVLEVFFTKETASYRASGQVGVATPLGPLQVPFAYDGSFPVPKLPTVTLEKPVVEAMTLSGARVVFPIKVTNRNGFPLPVSGLNGLVTIAGANVGSASASVANALGPHETRTLHVPLEVSFMQAGFAVANMIRGGDGPVTLKGALHAGSFNLPIDFATNLR